MAASALRLGTRGSQLALWQARTVAERIAARGGPPCEIVIIKTSGDQLQEAPLSEAGGKRLFVKEIEDALLKGAIDLAVHSSKDMPAELPAGLSVAAVLPREDPRDAVVLPIPSASAQHEQVRSIEELVTRLGNAPNIGTGSVRRISQLIRVFPGAHFRPIRGNLDTRLRKIDAGEHDALVLAVAGLKRLGFASRISLMLPADVCVPAPGQGIIAIEVRLDDTETTNVVAAVDDRATRAALDAERAVVTALGGGCQTPIGAVALPAGDGGLEVTGIVVAVDGSRAIRAHARGPLADAAKIGASVAAKLIADGAADILAESRESSAPIARQP
jgi:hydroxymethylbilane synthase